jgi:hypothetical protein
MPFIIPAAATGVGIALTVWGGRHIITGDDTPDQAAGDILQSIPAYFRDYILDVEVQTDAGGFSGVTIQLTSDAPDRVKQEVQEKVELEDRTDGVEVVRSTQN